MTSKLDSPALLNVQHFSLHHLSETGSTTILNDVSFVLRRGEILGIIGESGAGKSTLGNAVLGLLPAGMQQVSGTIMFEGRPIDSQASNSFRRKKISAIFQDPYRFARPADVCR